MKVFVVGTGILGGLRTHLVELLRFLVAEGHTPFVAIVTDDATDWLRSGLAGKIAIPHTSNGVIGKLRKLAAVTRAESALRRFQPDLFVATAPGGGYARLARCARNTSAFALWQAVTIPSSYDPLATTMTGSVDAVAVQSPGMLRPFCDAIPAAKHIAALPCFFEPLQSDCLAQSPRSDEPIRLAFFGRLAGNKGLVPFLEVFRNAAQRTPLQFDIHGGGEERAALESEITRLDLGQSVRLCGRYPSGAGYAELLAKYHALVMPSIDCEGVPLVLLEAMSLGLPLLATNIGGMADVGIDNPDVIIRSPPTLADGLNLLIARLRAGEISSTRLKQHFDAHFSHRQVAAAWGEMLASPSRFFGIESVAQP